MVNLRSYQSHPKNVIINKSTKKIQIKERKNDKISRAFKFNKDLKCLQLNVECFYFGMHPFKYTVSKKHQKYRKHVLFQESIFYPELTIMKAQQKIFPLLDNSYSEGNIFITIFRISLLHWRKKFNY